MEWTSFSSRGSSVGDDAEQHLAGLAGVAALAVEHGHAAVDLGQNGGADLIRPGADDLDLGAAVAQHQHLVHDDGVGDDQHDAVEHLLRLAERRLHQQDGDIKEHHGDGHRPAEPFLQHQRGYPCRLWKRPPG